jgi:phytoene dehydrogenase-like protein
MKPDVTIVGGGLGGLTAAVAAGERGWSVRLLEAHDHLGGRARTSGGPYRANRGPHVVYSDGPLWAWLDERT